MDPFSRTFTPFYIKMTNHSLSIFLGIFATLLSVHGLNEICTSPQYLELGETDVIQCFFADGFLAVLWYNSTAEEAILTYKNNEKSGRGYMSGEFDIFPNGSLIIQNVSLSHERYFRVTEIKSQAGETESYPIAVKTFVHPRFPYPVIEMCDNEREVCYIHSTGNVNLSCFVYDSRPAMKLTWTLINADSKSTISSYYAYSIDNVTYTANATTMTQLYELPHLSLFVCQASGTSWLLEKNDALMLLETRQSSPVTETYPVYFEINSKMKLECTRDNVLLLVWKRYYDNKGPDVLLYGVFMTEILIEFYTNEFGVEEAGSLLIEDVQVRHEGLYQCLFNSMMTTNGEVNYDVHVYVNPQNSVPVVEGCNNQQYCVLDVQSGSNITCSVFGIRPAVDLEWRLAFMKEIQIILTNQEQRVEKRGDVFDVILITRVDIVQNSYQRVILECLPKGATADLFKFYTLQLILLISSDENNKGSNRLLWLLLLIVIPLLVNVGIIIYIIVAKDRRNRSRQRRPENVPLVENYDKKDLFVKQLKTKYEQIYEDVKPIPFLEDMCSVDKVFIQGAIEVLEKETHKETHKKKWKPLQHYHQLVKLTLDSGRHIIEGEPGYGKSTLVIQLLYEWCKGTDMSLRRDIDILIFLPLRQLTGLDSLFKAIKQFILPEHSTISEDDVKNIIQSSSSVLVILDGYDEYAEKDTKATFVSSLLTKNLLPDAFVILTTRSSCLPKKYFPKTERTRLKGFNEEARDEYIRKVIVGDDSSLEKLKLKLRENPILNYLCDIPLFFVMFAHITSERDDFQDVKSATKFFRCIVKCLHEHMRNKGFDEDQKKEIDLLCDHHGELDKVAFEALSKKMPQIVWKRNFLRKRLGHEFYDQIIRVGILIEEDFLNLNESPSTMENFYNQRRVRFYHKLFCEWYAAHHFARIIEANPKKCIDNLANGLDLHDLQYVYRFACGLSDSAAMRIITDIKCKAGGMKLSILCTLEQDGSTENMREIVTKLGSTFVSIGEDDNMLQQRATIEILQFAGVSEIPMQGLYLENLFRSVDIAKDIVTLQSDVSLPCTALKTLTELWITEEGREFTDKEVKDILWYASKCTSLNKLWFVECLLPKNIQCGSLAPATRSWGIDVLWFDHHLNLTTGSWENTSGEDITDEIYNESVNRIRDVWRDTNWQLERI